MRRIFFCIYFGLTVVAASAQTARVHTVKSGESLYAISKQYGVTVEQITRMNSMKSTALKPGDKLTIPTKGVAVKVVPPPASQVQVKTTPARVHTVTKGETIYAISKKYGVTTTEIKQWNNLADLNLKIGQKLIVSKLNNTAVYKPLAVPSTPDTPYQQEDVRPRFTYQADEMPPVEEKKTPEPTITIEPAKPVVTNAVPPAGTLKVSSNNPVEYPSFFNNYSAGGFKIKKSRGEANYIMDETSGNQYLAFYNDAEVGSVIRVTNMLNQKTIYAKVVGKVPPLDAQTQVMVKLSNQAATELGASDDRLAVEVASYSN
ncbi:MAG: LysM peptidoglycan-binding domain-containing protein [Chitinophagales bacterium]